MLNYLHVLYTLFTYPCYSASIRTLKCTGCFELLGYLFCCLLPSSAAFSRLFEDQFKDVDIPFTLFIVLHCVLGEIHLTMGQWQVHFS